MQLVSQELHGSCHEYEKETYDKTVATHGVVLLIFVATKAMLECVTRSVTVELTRSPALTSQSLRTQRIASLPITLDLPENATIRANGIAIFVESQDHAPLCTITLESAAHSVFDRLPRDSSDLVERTLPSGARYYRSTIDGHVTVFVALEIPNGRLAIARSSEHGDAICQSLRRLPS